MMARLDLTINAASYPGTCALIYDDAARKAHASYPAPTNAARERMLNLLRNLHRRKKIFFYFCCDCEAIFL